MNTEIFLPIFYMLCLTTAVFLFSTLIRIKEIYLNDSKNAISGSEHKHPPFQQGSDILKNSQRNEPKFLPLIANEVVKNSKVSRKLIISSIFLNSLRFFGLD